MTGRPMLLVLTSERGVIDGFTGFRSKLPPEIRVKTRKSGRILIPEIQQGIHLGGELVYCVYGDQIAGQAAYNISATRTDILVHLFQITNQDGKILKECNCSEFVRASHDRMFGCTSEVLPTEHDEDMSGLQSDGKASHSRRPEGSVIVSKIPAYAMLKEVKKLLATVDTHYHMYYWNLVYPLLDQNRQPIIDGDGRQSARLNYLNRTEAESAIGKLNGQLFSGYYPNKSEHLGRANKKDRLAITNGTDKIEAHLEFDDSDQEGLELTQQKDKSATA
ncbi:hypothetical protein BDV96DRAFT_647113 [Lophiotrema nucula]|uniref:RRM domain-containing protein n=1 Tax=Lophiotrema nucula TaxID=690887 RepID=A0A6A5Z5U4_9PLEO|nr:hypothetical protein BDV96DRAFT_647113 [Lophiotrema nucula]